MAAKVKAASIDIKALGLISGMFYTNRFDKLGLFLPKYLYGRDYKKSSYAKYVNPGKYGADKCIAAMFSCHKQKRIT